SAQFLKALVGPDDTNKRMSRILATTAVFAVLAAPAAAQNQGGAQPASWAQPQIKLVVSHGLMANSIQTFHPNDPLTRGALAAARTRFLDRAYPAVPCLGHGAGPAARRRLHATHPLCLADADPADGGSLHRLPLRLGWHQRERRGALRSPGSGRFRLLRIR